MVDEHWEELRKAKERGQKVVWGAGPLFLLTSSQEDLVTHFMPGYASYCAGRQMASYVLEAAEADGELRESCSYHRLHMGMCAIQRKGLPLANEQVRLPMPDFFILSRVCTEQSHYAEAVYRETKCPVVAIDLPAPYSEDHDEIGGRYVEKQLKEVAIPAIEKLTGRRYNFDRLSAALAQVKQTVKLRNQCVELQANIPAPCTIFDLCVSVAPVMYIAGKPGCIEYYEKLKAELEYRVARKIGGISEERYRLLWDHIMMWGWLGPLSRKLRSYGANLVVGRYPLGMWWREDLINPEDPLRALADVWTHAPLRDPRRSVKKFEEWVEKFHLDGLVMMTSRSCRLFNGGQLDMLNEIERKCGVPGIVLDADMVDPAFYSEAQIDTRLQALAEMIDGRKRVRSSGLYKE
jgi:benzoyl-CoA reductase/2-hydroxyglutaryl-CoA dehydratase subunit BcrC/BadD/HgdB